VLATTGAFRAWRFAYQRLSTFSSTVTREQVKAKLGEATRRGLVSMGEDDVLIATAEQGNQLFACHSTRFLLTVAGCGGVP